MLENDFVAAARATYEEEIEKEECNFDNRLAEADVVKNWTRFQLPEHFEYQTLKSELRREDKVYMIDVARYPDDVEQIPVLDYMSPESERALERLLIVTDKGKLHRTLPDEAYQNKNYTYTTLDDGINNFMWKYFGEEEDDRDMFYLQMVQDVARVINRDADLHGAMDAKDSEDLQACILVLMFYQTMGKFPPPAN